ncbi:efflux RND transporter permease subunit [Pelomonas aquatica]|jgi:multidrug efflux pump subunit AcrB|uniref:Efflux RND transporter permease subunit n=1 Tax=Pelomonas aquatica TaxID=431058 RepID=A0A9X4LLI0_9BURK|nr:efflux RND transporter permease subunit [Pelomonas aquatica]MCY4754103.1 efflux RND transporter permease subunit [Pelomonas aquatica]MDG0862403.1 efflux RND transporter permease subunit [Pelomonas aquatica]
MELGMSGRIARFFQSAQITPLLALVALLLGIFSVAVTPREEEPQINVTMANVLIPFPGAAVQDVEQMVATPAEQVLSQMAGVEHVMSVSRPGLAVMTVQFKVGVPRTEALVRLYDTVQSHADWLPANLGTAPPLVKPKGIDDVPIVTLTLHARDGETGAFDLERIAHSLEADLKRVPGTREVTTIGGPGRAIRVELDPARLAAAGVAVAELRQALQSANSGAAAGQLLAGDRAVDVEAGPFLRDARELGQLVVGARNGRPVYLADVAQVVDGPLPAQRYVWHGSRAGEFPAVTLAITKKPGENAIQVADALMQRVAELRNAVIPNGVDVAETRNYGATANDKAMKLIQKLMFATASVVALVFIALGRREAAIVGSAVILTLAVTLFASWAWGFTLNRVSLFALIFSIGILVDDAIVVVENIHRHMALHPDKTLAELIPGAVDEVGGPTILATLTVIAALLPMAFVSGLMGPYMSPIPINASMGMLLSLAIAFIVTPWLARLWLRHGGHAGDAAHGLAAKLGPLFERVFRPLLDEARGARNRRWLGTGVAGLIVLSLALPAVGLVVLKMLPFDNKSEFQVIVDMPAGTPLERTAAVLHDLGAYMAQQPEVTDYQAYAGAAAPINFNGLVRQYYLRAGGEVGDLQVNLVDKHHRSAQSHAIATRMRPALQDIGRRHGANVKVVEVPPGPPVLSPIVAEIYGPDAPGRRQVALEVRRVFERTPGLVDVDDSGIAAAPKKLLLVDRRKAALLGVPQAAIVSTLATGLAGEAAAWLHDGSKYPASAWLQLPAERQGDLDPLLQLNVRSAGGALVPLRELVTVSDSQREQPLFHKDGLPVHFVVGDMAGALDSPLYGMFKMRGALAQIGTPDGGTLAEAFIHAPSDAWRGYTLKWDGEWQVTYETFRDMGAAYAVGLVLIYLLVVAQFGSYLTPLIIMAPIPLTLVGVMPGHALLGAQFTATSMIGMIALAGIIVRNSILLVDFIRLEVARGRPLKEAVVHSAATRAQPIVLTGLAAMLGAFFILDDPIFNGLAISLIFGILVSTLLTLVVIPLLYFVAYRHAPLTDTRSAS